MSANYADSGSFVASGDAAVRAQGISGTDGPGAERVSALNKIDSNDYTQRSSFLDAGTTALSTSCSPPLAAAAPRTQRATQWLGEACARAGVEDSPDAVRAAAEPTAKMGEALCTLDRDRRADPEGTSTALGPSDDDAGGVCADDGSDGSTIVLDEEDDGEANEMLVIEDVDGGSDCGSAVIVLSDSESEPAAPPSSHGLKCQKKRGNKIALQPRSDLALVGVEGTRVRLTGSGADIDVAFLSL